MSIGKKGILVVNLGTPDNPERKAVSRYLKQFLLDGRVIDYPWLSRQLLVRGIIVPFRAGNSSKLYQELWTEEGSPLKIYGEKVAEDLQKLLGEDYHVELAMRYQSPSIESAIDKLLKAGVSEIVVFPMFPQYASATTGSVHEEVMRILSEEWTIPPVKLINSYFDHPAVIEVFAENAQKFDLKEYDHIIFSYHGVPQRHLTKSDRNRSHCLKKDNCCSELTTQNQFCYSAQCHATTSHLAKALNLSADQYTTAFQSRLGKEVWTQPYTIEVIEKLAEKGAKKLLVFSPAFVADCLETTIEIGFEYQEEFEKMGGEKIDLVPSLNDHPKWVSAIRDIVTA